MTNLIVVDIFLGGFLIEALDTLGCKNKNFTDNTCYKATDELVFFRGFINQSTGKGIAGIFTVNANDTFTLFRTWIMNYNSIFQMLFIKLLLDGGYKLVKFLGFHNE